MVTLNLYGRGYELEREFLEYFSERDFDEHYESLVTPGKPEGVSYTYGERLRDQPVAGDQLELLTKKLRNSPDTRRAVAVLWSHEADQASSDPPCLILVQGDVTLGYYSQTAYIRSNDIYAAWPLNAYAQVRLAERVAEKLGLKIGTVTLVSFSAHVYEHDWSRALAVIHDHYDALKAFTQDPRGSYLIYGRSGLVEVDHREPGGTLVTRLELRDSTTAYYKLKSEAVLLLPDHAFYLGWEARRALERALRKEEYVQDEEM